MSDAILHSDLAAMPEAGKSIFGAKRWRLWVLLGEVALIGTGVAFLYWPVLTVANVTYEGPADWESEVRSLATLPSDGNILHFIPADAQSRIESRFSERGDVQVCIDLPNRIEIHMHPYQPRLWGDGDIGIGNDGSLLTEPATHPDLPRWHAGIDWEGDAPLAERAKRAAGAWDELTHADRRYELITSDWTFDPENGWTTTAVDGRTRVMLGNALIGERARMVAQLLDQGDTLLAKPSLIDARFAGQLLLKPFPKVVVDSTDSNAGVVADNEQPHTKDVTPAKSKPVKGRI